VVYRAEDPALPSRLREAFRQEVVCHFATFDLPWLCLAFDLPVPERIWDTMAAEAVLTAGLELELGLGPTVARRLGLELDKSLQTSDWSGELSPEQLEYARRDAAVLLPLARAQEELLRQEGLWRIWELELACTPAFVRMARYGVPFQPELLRPYLERVAREREALALALVDSLGRPVVEERLAAFDRARAELARWEAERERVAAELAREWEAAMAAALAARQAGAKIPEAMAKGPAEWPERWRDLHTQKGEFLGQKRFLSDNLRYWEADHPRPPKPVPPEPFNPASPEQVKLALHLLGYTDLDSVAEERLATYPFREEHRPLVETLLRYRALRKVESAFGEPLVSAVWPDGRLRPVFRQVGTASGRPTASRPNLLQLPSTAKAPELRQAVRAPEGYRLVVADYSQIELRLLAQLSGDPAMIDAFRQGEDIHLAMAKKIFGPQAGAKERKVAKSCSFLTVYGGGARRLLEVASQGGIVLDLEEARGVIEDWKRAFAQAWAALESWREAAMRERLATSAWGRKRRFRPEETADEVARAGANHRIQATAADMMKLAMAVVDRLVAPAGGWIALQVYDELVVVVPEGVAEWGARVVEQAMRRAAATVLTEVPVEVGLVLATSWAEKE